MSRVLVTGANGFLGLWLVRGLIDEGQEVLALVRNPNKEPELQKLKCQIIQGDVTDLKSLESAFAKVEAVFHLAGLIAYRRSDREQMEKVNVLGTANVLVACEHQQVKRLVHLSSVVTVGAGFDPHQILNENSQYNLEKFNFGYFETKRKAEELVMTAVNNQKIDAVIVNPSTIYGAGDLKKGSRKTQVKVAQGKFPFYTSGGVSVVAVEDVVAGVLAAWHRGRTGERYILSGENLLIKDLFQIIAQCAGVSVPKYKIPDWILLLLGRTGDFLSSIGITTSLSYENAKVATLYHWFDCAKAQKELGFNPRPAKEALQKSVDWLGCVFR
ncbi:MAG TPA: NAD-dependent epimerase/dehydratase family protein [Pseudobdellovibrionaceae bacterium]|nr:NAD-dependent epimerase/dehydratase family protein [Pseudobdellovibrionaceae bacterium]